MFVKRVILVRGGVWILTTLREFCTALFPMVSKPLGQTLSNLLRFSFLVNIFLNR